MDIIWAKNNKTAKYILFVLLGESDNKLILLRSAQVPDNEARKLRSNRSRLDGMPIRKRMEWVKDKMPVSYKSAFRHIKKDDLAIIRRYPIKS